MKAVICTKYGSPKVLEVQEIDKPRPKANEVLIKVQASSMTAADSIMRQGTPWIGRLFLGLFKPKTAVTGTGFSGIVEEIGDGVTQFKPGDEVFGESIFGYGTNAEYTCVAEGGVIAIKPENISFEEAAPVADGPLTSINFLKRMTTIKPGQKVLINGASGALGTAAIQIAKYYGAEVIGVCSTKNIDTVYSLGADRVIDYTQTDFTQTEEAYDIIYDAVGKSSFFKTKKALKKNGLFLTPVLTSTLLIELIFSTFSTRNMKFSATGTLSVKELKELFSEVKEIIEAGKLTTLIDRTYSFEQVQEAHEYLDSGRKVGNLVLEMRRGNI